MDNNPRGDNNTETGSGSWLRFPMLQSVKGGKSERVPAILLSAGLILLILWIFTDTKPNPVMYLGFLVFFVGLFYSIFRRVFNRLKKR